MSAMLWDKRVQAIHSTHARTQLCARVMECRPIDKSKLVRTRARVVRADLAHAIAGTLSAHGFVHKDMEKLLHFFPFL